MQRQNAVILAGVLISLMIVLVGASLAPGAFFVGKHEGDMFHLLQVLFRMEHGQLPHEDFVTPIGVLAFAPIVVFLKAGFGVGKAFLLGQALVAVAFFPAVWWVSASRFRGGWACLFGAGVMVLLLALVHGTVEPSISPSMHYNRWAWAAAFLALAAAILPGQGRAHALADGIVIGLALSVMALTKVTFFAAFAVPILVALVGRGTLRTGVWAVLTGLVVIAGVTLMMGPAYWTGYLSDLLVVSGSIVRPQPGMSLKDVISAPSHLVGTAVLILSVVLLRQAERGLEGLVLLLLVPGFLYVTWQNSGNDPQWLALLGMLLWMLRPTREIHNAIGWDMQKGVGMAALAALVLAAPSFINMAWSPFRHLNVNPAGYAAVLPDQPRHADLRVATLRNHRADAKIPLDGAGSMLARDDVPARVEATTFMGEELANCTLGLGMAHWFATIAADLKSSGLVDGQSMFTTDVLSSFWLFGASDPLPGGAPWYYGGLSGFENADLVLVPLCPISAKLRKVMLADIAATDTLLAEVRRTELYILYRK